jgi:anti-sigma B factor antagonist
MALLQVKTLPDVTVAAFTAGSLDESNVESFGKELSALADGLGDGWLQLDLGGLRVMTSVGLGKLFSLYRKVLLGGGRLSLRNVRPEVYELFAITRLTDILDVQPALEGGGQRVGVGAAPQDGITRGGPA